MLRSFSVVGALAAAALALIIGIFAFNSHSQNQHGVPGGGSQSGVANHPAVAATLVRAPDGSLIDLNAKPAPGGNRLSSGDRSATTGFRETGGFSGASAASAPPAPRAAPCGVLGGLLSLVGGLLGGGGSC